MVQPLDSPSAGPAARSAAPPGSTAPRQVIAPVLARAQATDMTHSQRPSLAAMARGARTTPPSGPGHLLTRNSTRPSCRRVRYGTAACAQRRRASRLSSTSPTITRTRKTSRSQMTSFRSFQLVQGSASVLMAGAWSGAVLPDSAVSASSAVSGARSVSGSPPAAARSSGSGRPPRRIGGRRRPGGRAAPPAGQPGTPG